MVSARSASPYRTPAPAATDRAQVEALLRDLGMTFSTGDEAAFLALLADDAVWMPPDRPAVTGRAAIGAWFRESQASLAQHLTFRPVDVQFDRDWAIAQTHVTGTVVPRAGGATIMADNKAFFVLKRAPDGRWLFWRDIWNRNQPLAR
jgi:uncharacterized protein (TIGR02246 family)